jgi:hypothetical protein
MVERLSDTTQKEQIIGKYAIISGLSIAKIQENPEKFKKFIARHKKMSHIHGATEAVAGASFLFMASHLQASDQATILTYCCLGHLYLIGAYITVEGALDMITGQRKHELTSTILEKLGMRRWNYNLSVPRTSELEKLLDQNNEV